MKNIFLITLFLIGGKCFGQKEKIVVPIDSLTGKCNFTEIIKVDSAKAGTLYNRAKLFIANSYNSAKNVTQLADENLHTIVVKAYMTTYSVNWAGILLQCGGFNYSLKIYCKDGRYKYEITDVVHTNLYDTECGLGGAIENEKPSCGTNNMSKKMWENLKMDCIKNINELTASLKKSMSTKSATEKSDW